MAYSVKDKLKQSYTRLVRPVQNSLQQAQLAKIAYNREQASGGVGKRLMANPITYAGGAMTNELYKVGKQGLSSAKNLLPGGTPAKPTDAYNVINAVAAPFTTIPKFLVGGGINIGMQGVSNKMQGNPFINKNTWGETFAQGASKAPFYTALSAINPLSAIKPQTTGPLLSRMAQNVTTGAIREGLVEGPIEGAMRPLQQGETRWNAIANDMIYGSLFGAGTEIGGEAARLGKGMVKVVGDKIQIDPSKFVRVKGDTSPVWDDKTKRYRVNGQFYKKMKEQVDFLNERKPIQVMRGGQLVTEIQPRWRDQGGFIKPDEFVSKTTPSIPKAPPSLSGTAKQIQQSAPTAGMPGANVSLPKQNINQLSPQKIVSGIQPQGKTNTSPNQGSLDSIIAEGRKQIGSSKPEPKQSVRQAVSDAYTQWVDRYHPIVSAAGKAKKTLQSKGATLRPEYDPEYLVRRLTGAGGIADARFRNELEPIIKQLDDLAIPKADLDVYLANRRIAGFGKAGREVYGADVTKANQITGALEAKYGQNIRGITDKLYGYQNKGFQEMVEAGFMSPETAKLMQQENPDYSPLYRVMDEVNDYLGLPTRKAMQGSQPIKKIKGSKRQIESPLESIIGNTFSQRAAIEKNRVAKSIIDLQNITDLGFKQAAKSGDSTITVWKNGQKEYWDVGKDIADVAKGTNEEAMNMVLKIIQAPASLLRQGATGRNPEFMIPNIIRDQLDAGVTSKYGYVPFLDYISGLKSMLAKDDVYKAWERSGAKIDLGEMSGKKSIAKYFDEKTAKKGLFSWLGAGLDVAGKYSEQPTRLGLFKKAYNKTGNEMLAMMESRDSTVDFARMGAKMKVANSIIPFLNVSVQGFDKLIRATKNNPGKVLFNAALYGAGPAAAVTAYNLNFHPEEYAEIPQYEKDSNFVLVKGRNANGQVDYITIPKGNIIPTIANPIQSFMEFAAQNSQQDFKQMALTLLSTTLPVVGEGQSLQEIATKTIGSNLPQAIKPAAENLVNKSFYKYDTEKEQSKEIVPYYLQDKPDYQQDYEFTPVMYKKIGALINASPLKVQNIMEGYLAGYSKIPSNIIQSLTKVSRGEEISPNETILMRRFIKQTYPGGEKKTTEKPVSPGVMDRITGKTSAASAGIAQTIPSDPEEAKIFYKQALQEINNAKGNRIKYTYDSSLTEDERKKKLDDEMEKNIRAVNTINQMRKKNPDQVFGYELESHATGGSKTTEQRAKWVHQTLKTAKSDKELSDLLRKLYQGKVLTQSVAEMLNEEYGLNLTHYMSGDKLKSLGGSGKKGKKTISDAQILSSYRKTLEAYAKPRAQYKSFSEEMGSRQSAPIRLKRQKLAKLY